MGSCGTQTELWAPAWLGARFARMASGSSWSRGCPGKARGRGGVAHHGLPSGQVEAFLLLPGAVPSSNTLLLIHMFLLSVCPTPMQHQLQGLSYLLQIMLPSCRQVLLVLLFHQLLPCSQTVLSRGKQKIRKHTRGIFLILFRFLLLPLLHSAYPFLFAFVLFYVFYHHKILIPSISEPCSQL